MNKKEPQNCWEFWDCEVRVKEECPAYTTDSGKDCWYVAGSYNKYPNCRKAKKLFTACWECPWFKKLNPDFEKNRIEH